MRGGMRKGEGGRGEGQDDREGSGEGRRERGLRERGRKGRRSPETQRDVVSTRLLGQSFGFTKSNQISPQRSL